MVGLGTQDSFGQAQDFVSSFGTVSFPMLWDGSFESWNALGIRGQPAGMLLSRDGRIVDSWSGPIPEDRVEELIPQL